MAYAVVTLVEAIAGGRKAAASTFQISDRVLRTIRHLASTKGDAETLRKFEAGMRLDPLTGAESSWLEAAIRRVVRRMGEHAAGVPLVRITMDDLPKL